MSEITASPSMYKFGGFWARFFAFVIDSILISALCFLLFLCARPFYDDNTDHVGDYTKKTTYNTETYHDDDYEKPVSQSKKTHISSDGTTITITTNKNVVSSFSQIEDVSIDDDVYDHGTLFLILYPLLASAFYVSPWQATPGKRCFSLKVLTYRGETISMGTALLRAFLVFALPFGIILIPFHRRKQALHDVIAHTLVVKEKPVITMVVS